MYIYIDQGIPNFVTDNVLTRYWEEKNLKGKFLSKWS